MQAPPQRSYLHSAVSAAPSSSYRQQRQQTALARQPPLPNLAWFHSSHWTLQRFSGIGRCRPAAFRAVPSYSLSPAAAFQSSWTLVTVKFRPERTNIWPHHDALLTIFTNFIECVFVSITSSSTEIWTKHCRVDLIDFHWVSVHTHVWAATHTLTHYCFWECQHWCCWLLGWCFSSGVHRVWVSSRSDISLGPFARNWHVLPTACVSVLQVPQFPPTVEKHANSVEWTL